MNNKNKKKKHSNLRTGMVFFFIIMIALSAKAIECPGYYITKKLDTVQCTINISENIFYKGVYDFHRISEKVKIDDSEGFKKFLPQEIISFVLYVPSGDTCKFVSLLSDNRYFYHEITVGKITMYIRYMTHPYDGGKITECVLLKNNKFTTLGFMNTRKKQKTKVTLLLSDNQDLIAKWETIKFNLETLKAILIEYNK